MNESSKNRENQAMKKHKQVKEKKLKQHETKVANQSNNDE